jgi:hypothetical protein
VTRVRRGLTVAVVAAVSLAALMVLRGVHGVGEEPSMTGAQSATSGVTAGELERVSRTRVFFGHQSVGMNVLDGVPAVYAAHGLASPVIAQDSVTPGPSGGFVDHRFLGRNEDPLGKIKDFDAVLRAGVGQQAGVAMMKFCYIDITSSTDVEALFTTYRRTMITLERDFPGVSFVAVTVPLTTEQGMLAKVKNLVRGSDRMSAAENVVRERLNTLIRQQYTGARLFDLAAAESTAPDGSRVAGTAGGQPYFALYDGYSSDGAHLNAAGSQVVAAAWLRAVAAAAGR